MNSSEVATQLCLKCGICCNGVLFNDVQLLPADNPDRLKQLGLPVTSPSPGKNSQHPAPCRFAQPCTALQADRTCRVYPDRPSRCAGFECLLFMEVKEGKMQLSAALRVVKNAQTKANRVDSLLRQLDDPNTSLALSLRFQKMSAKMERTPPSNPDHLDLYAELTLAVHDLNVLLGGAFYP